MRAGRKNRRGKRGLDIVETDNQVICSMIIS